jgi:hypothetical protein
LNEANIAIIFEVKAMDHSQKAFLIITKGDPYHQGEIILLPEGEILLGRAWETHRPEISFTSHYVSRQHATITNCNGQSILRPHPAGKAYTKVNDKLLAKDESHKLQHGDEIILAGGHIELIYCSEIEPGDTLFVDSQNDKLKITLDEERRKITINNQSYTLNSIKRYELFRLLYQQSPGVVSRMDIKKAVWSERECHNGLQLVGDEEVDAMVYNLKKDLSPYGNIIQTIRGYGYVLLKESE